MKFKFAFLFFLSLLFSLPFFGQPNLLPRGRNLLPADNDSCVSVNPQLCVQVRDANGDSLLVRFYWRPSMNAPRDFTTVGLPDTQFYTASVNGGTPSMFRDQTNWIVAQKDTLNIVHVMQLGDCTNYGDNSGNDYEWKHADTAMKIIEDPLTTNLPEGISYTMNVGNHDQYPNGDPNGTTIFFNQYFGLSRFSGRSYWGGNYQASADNSFQLFSASGYDFLVVSLEFDQTANPLVLNWADSLLQAYPNRKAIIVSHYLLNLDGTFGAQGAAIYNTLKDNPNLFLMLCGHMHGEAHRTDVFNGDTVHTILADYQATINGGNGLLRIMTFSPELNTLSVKSYSPTIHQFENDTDSRFVLPVSLYPQTPYTCFDSVWIDSAGVACVTLNNLAAGSGYDWFATVTDDSVTVKLDYSRFATFGPTVTLTAAMDSVCMDENPVALTGTPAGGVYTGPGVLLNQFDPSVGFGNYSLFYTYVAPNGCAASDSILMHVLQPCTGIFENENGPVQFNYAHGQFAIPSLGQDGVLYIYDLTGRELFEANCRAGANLISANQPFSGIYCFRILYKDGSFVSGRFHATE